MSKEKTVSATDGPTKNSPATKNSNRKNQPLSTVSPESGAEPFCQSGFTETFDGIYRRIWKSLEISDSKLAQHDDRESVIRMSVRDHKTLMEIARQWRDFTTSVATLRLKHSADPNLPDEVHREKYENLKKSLSQFSESIKVDDDLVHAKSLERGKTKAEVFAQQRIGINDKTRQLVQSFIDDLDAMVGVNVISFIQWTDDTVCYFESFSHELVSEVDESIVDTQSERVQSDEERERLGSWLERHRVRFEIKGHHTYRVTRHQQHLIHAESNPLGTPGAEMPRQYIPLVDKLPDILKRFVRVVKGEAFRSTECEHLLKNEEFELAGERTLVTEYFDPVAILGPFALFAWDDVESDRETMLQQAERAPAELFTNVLMTSIFAMLGFVCLAIGMAYWSLLVVVAFIMFGVSVKYFMQTASKHAYSKRRIPNGYYRYYSMFTFVAVELAFASLLVWAMSSDRAAAVCLIVFASAIWWLWVQSKQSLHSCRVLR